MHFIHPPQAELPCDAPAAPGETDGLVWLGHELRTPMTSLKGAIDLLAAGALAPVPAALAPLLAIAQRNSDRLSDLLDDMAHVSTCQAEVPIHCLRPTDLGALVRQVIAGPARPDGTLHRRIILTDDAPNARVLADPPLLARAFSRVLEHAQRAAAPRSHVEITITLTGAGNRLCIRHRGISDRADMAPDHLGLASARAIIVAHGGTMLAEMMPATGTTWHIDLPAAW